MQKHSFSLLATGLLVLSTTTTALSAPINGYNDTRNYSTRRENRAANDIVAVKSVLTGGWDSIQPGSIVASGNRPFVAIHKDMWARFSQTGTNSPDCYIEILNTSNNTNPSDALTLQSLGFAQAIAPSYKGYVIAVTQYDKFSPSPTFGQVVQKAYIYGGNASTASKTGGTIELTKAGPVGQWQAKINNVLAYDQNLTCASQASSTSPVVSYPAPAAKTAEWGLESNDTTNSFTNNTSMTATRRIGTSVYTPPPSSTPVPQYQNFANWTNTYDATTGKIIFNRP